MARKSYQEFQSQTDAHVWLMVISYLYCLQSFNHHLAVFLVGLRQDFRIILMQALLHAPTHSISDQNHPCSTWVVALSATSKSITHHQTSVTHFWIDLAIGNLLIIIIIIITFSRRKTWKWKSLPDFIKDVRNCAHCALPEATAIACWDLQDSACHSFPLIHTPTRLDNNDSKEINSPK